MLTLPRWAIGGFLNWSFPLFRLFGIPVRAHWTLALVIAGQLLASGVQGGGVAFGYRAVTMAILFLSVLIHEFSHCGMAVLRGGHAHDVLLTPLGGLSQVSHPGSPSDELRVAGVGPLSNFAICGLTIGALVATGARVEFERLNPFEAWWYPDYSALQNWTLHAFRINAVLGLFNLLIPAYPLDGGRVLFAFLTMRYGRTRAAETTALIAIPVGAALAVWGFAQGEFFLLLIGIFVVMEAVQLRQLVRAGMIDAHPGYGGTSEFDYRPERPRRKGWFARWRERRAAARRANEAAADVALRERVDAVLDKVSREGIGSLNADERRILDEASRRGRGE